MHILIVGPTELPIPPSGYGGAERFAYWLSLGLTSLGHDVTVICHQDSQIPHATMLHLGDNPELLCGKLLCHGGVSPYDAVVDNTYPFYVAELAHSQGVNAVTFTHGMGGPGPVNPVALSVDQKAKWNMLDLPVIHIGLPVDAYPFNPDPEPYLLYLGKITEIKGLHHFIDLCVETKSYGVVAGPIHDPHSTGYGAYQLSRMGRYNQAPGHRFCYVGEVHGQDKLDLVANAAALVFPTLVRESFGIVVAEAALCGTPTLTWDIGPMRELVMHEFTGYVGQGCFTLALKRGLDAVLKIDRHKVRRMAEALFNHRHMASKLVEVLETYANRRPRTE
jgi:glycosyltransferase involved in cell wall biosynthesis